MSTKDMPKQKRVQTLKRRRVNPTIRWGERITLDLITKVLECVKDSPESFEKPTTQRFYEKLANGSSLLQDIPWKCMREKMRHSKTSYIMVKKWKQQTAAGLVAAGDEKSVVEFMQRKCPHYDKLDQIFGERNNYNQSSVINTLQDLSSEEGSEFSIGTDHSMSASFADANETLEELPRTSANFSSISNNESNKRKRVTPMIRWGERITLDLIMRVVESVKDSPELFEKPTSQRFYLSLAKGSSLLQGIPWHCMKSKMRHCKDSYIEAKNWKQRTGAGLMEDGDEKSVVEYMQRKCPYYDKLDQIFGERNDYDQSSIVTPLPVISSEEGSEFSLGTEQNLSVSYEDAKETLEELPRTSGNFASIRNNEKKRRKRVNPMIRWGERVTLELIIKVVENVKDSHDSFEKPTAQRFYEKVANGCSLLQEIPWQCMRAKMRHFKDSYFQAKKWKQETGDGLIAAGDEKSVFEYMQRKCPLYDELHKIFGQRKSRLFEEIFCNNYDESAITAPLQVFSSPQKSECSFSMDHNLSVTCEDANQAPEDLPRTSDSVALNLLTTIQKEKLQLEREKFEWQKMKEQQDLDKFEWQKKKDQLEFDKFEWQKKKEQQELDKQLKIRQMELDKEERVQKFEIEFKYRKTNKQ